MKEEGKHRTDRDGWLRHSPPNPPRKRGGTPKIHPPVYGGVGGGSVSALRSLALTAFAFLFTINYTLFTATPAQAACASPTGPAGMVVFNTDYNMLQYCNNTSWIKMGPSSYFPNAVTFDGTNDWLSGSLSGLADSRRWTGSMWFKFNTLPAANFEMFDSNDAGDITVYWNGAAAKQFNLRARNSASAEIVRFNGSAINDTNWHHALWSFDLSDTAKRHLYIDGVADLAGVTTYTNDLIDFTNTAYYLGQEDDGSGRTNADFADIWMDFGTYIDLSIEANRRKFINGGAPVNPGPNGEYPTGTAPEIFLSGALGSWHTNKGTGGGFTVNGALTDAPADPPGQGDYASNLVGWWKLDETGNTSTAADSSGSGLDGTLTSFPADPTANWVSSPRGGALEFDGANDYINLGNPAALQITGAMTLAAWIYIDDFDNPSRIITKSTGTRGYELTIENIGTGGQNKANFMVASNSSTLIGVANNAALPAGQWLHLAGVYTPGVSLKIYVNGDLKNTRTTGIPASQYNPANNVNIGRRPNNTLWWDGKIDDARIYDRALSAADIADLYADTAKVCVNPPGTAGQTMYNHNQNAMQFCNGAAWETMNPIAASKTGLAAWWKLDEATGTSTADSAGVSTGTLTNGPVWQPSGGNLGAALSFDGSDDVVLAGSDASLDDLSAFTYSAWINPSGDRAGRLGLHRLQGHRQRRVKPEALSVARHRVLHRRQHGLLH